MVESKQKDTNILENWVSQFSDELFSWAFYKTSSKETAEDLVQETFLSAYRKLATFEGKSQPKTWLFAILNNKIVDHYRLSARTIKQQFSITEDSGFQLSNDIFTEDGCWRNDQVNPLWNQDEELLDNADFNLILQQCMEELPSKWKLAITSKYLTDKNTDQICQDLEMTTSNYWQVTHRAKLLMRKCLETKWI
ncbi:sigma-70 family RNA polymerase sigma factor [Flavobacterium frigidarium]|uniref:sigma-70 family RNA polymerase sigma factor n=1 Tax=Flavobacterium frigidarium TaxID=99286 RepID=UPI0003F816B7|nr:sigma-70 family RNA polymerase sigma factor [Flavobacterium frigidarium]